MTPTTGGGPQLTLFVARDQRHFGGDVAAGSIKLGKALTVRRDLNPGDQLTVTVTNAKGEQIAAGLYTVEGIGFAPIKAEGIVMGTERVHGTSLEDGDLLAPSLDPADPRND